MKFHRFIGLTALAVIVWSTAPARAGAVRETAGVLRYFNYSLAGRHNRLSGGYDFLINNQFQGNTISYGIGKFTLEGPVSLQVNTGTRGLRTLDVSFRTALNGQLPASPIDYLITNDVGAQASATTGSLLIDANFSINQLGYYDLDLTWSSRQDTAAQGILTDAGSMSDFDLGPIRARGNIYFDVLGVLTDPFFEAAGIANPFEALSGRQTLSSVFQSLSDRAANQLSEAAAAASSLTSRTAPAGNSPAAVGPVGARTVVPEPATMLLLVPGLALVGFAYRRIRAA
ncbi:MAG: PEP-CTERM sorting domain-containing protein [Phycisphaerae bacterium]|nr:PEP-CTERM sorting domain-containing protein [Phycisphaerae bacterium]